MTLNHPDLVDLLKRAYSAEKAAAFAYIGHAASVKNEVEKKAIRQIELDEWNHREEVMKLMKTYNVPVSKYYEFKFHVIGKLISASCFEMAGLCPFILLVD
jgi:rubrerythrin